MGDRSMFDPPRYATSGVMDTLSPELQFTLWAMVDILRLRSSVTPDYLQVFDLAPSDNSRDTLNQGIRHTQEQPQYLATNSLSVETPVTVRVFVIDDGTHCTMLFAQEY